MTIKRTHVFASNEHLSLRVRELVQAQRIEAGLGSLERLLETFIRDGVDKTRNSILRSAQSIPKSYKQLTAPVYRGCAALTDKEQLLTSGAPVKDHPLTSWSYNAREALTFARAAAYRLGNRFPVQQGVVLRRTTSEDVVVNFPDNLDKFGSRLQDAITDYDQEEILIATRASCVYSPKDVAALVLNTDWANQLNRKFKWGLKFSFKRQGNGQAWCTVVNPATNPKVLT